MSGRREVPSPSSWLRAVTRSSARSWTRLRRRIRERREARQVRRLQAPLHLLLTPLAQEVIRLGERQEQVQAAQQEAVLRLLERQSQAPMTAVQAELQHREVVSLLLELLQETQEPPELALARMVGLPTGRPTSLDSAS